MKYTMNFGRLASRPAPVKAPGKAFRIAVLGDFSGRANEGKLDTGEALAERKPWPVDVDNFEALVQRMGLRLHLPIAPDGGTVDVAIGSMDDFHPDQLFDRLDVFGELAGLRRRLKQPGTFAAAAAEVRSWPGTKTPAASGSRGLQSRGMMIPAGKLDDFARLIGRSRMDTRAAPVRELIRGIVGPHIVAAPNPEQGQLVAAVDEAIAVSMRKVLHHPDFQSLESIWRSAELLTRELETGTELQLVLYDISAEELAADLSSCDTLEETGLYKLLVEQPQGAGQIGPLSVFLGYYLFEQTPPHAELLGRIGKIAAAAQAPFIAAISTECLKKQPRDDIHPLISSSWNTLQSMPHAHYLGLTVPRFMLRWPYGSKTEPIDAFAFEEFTPQAGLKSMLWANGSILAGLLLGRTFSAHGLPGMRLGEIMTLDNVPFYYYIDADGDQVALPSTERLVTESLAAHIVAQHFMPVLCIRGRPEIRLGSFHSLGGPELAGPWSPRVVEPDEKLLSSPRAAASEEVAVLTVEAFESRAAAEAESELDALLSEVQSPPADSADRVVVRTGDELTAETRSLEIQQPSPPGTEGELDALLATLAPKEGETTAGESGIDPDLAALLAEL